MRRYSPPVIRGIAADASVSPGLVQHHFGSKEERAACDAYVMSTTATPIMRYLARALVDDSPASAALFDEMVAMTVTPSFIAVKTAAAARTSSNWPLLRRYPAVLPSDLADRAGTGLDRYQQEQPNG